jgi:hypothetical protein
MNYNLIIQPEAEYDIQNTFEWYESQNPRLDSEFVRAVWNWKTTPYLPSYLQTGKKSINPPISLCNSLRF